jgi:hypothetical protein
MRPRCCTRQRFRHGPFSAGPSELPASAMPSASEPMAFATQDSAQPAKPRRGGRRRTGLGLLGVPPICSLCTTRCFTLYSNRQVGPIQCFTISELTDHSKTNIIEQHSCYLQHEFLDEHNLPSANRLAGRRLDHSLTRGYAAVHGLRAPAPVIIVAWLITGPSCRRCVSWAGEV